METAFADPQFFAQHGQHWEAHEARLKSARERIPQLYARWEELERIKSGETPPAELGRIV